MTKPREIFRCGILFIVMVSFACLNIGFFNHGGGIMNIFAASFCAISGLMWLILFGWNIVDLIKESKTYDTE